MGGFINDAIHKVRLNRGLANNTSQRHFNKRGYTNKNAYHLESQKSPKLSIEELKILEEKCKRDLAKEKL